MSKLVKVTAPRTDFRGTVAGITFVDGEAEFDRAEHPGAYQYFQTAGYAIDGEVVNEAPGAFRARQEPPEPAPGTPANPTGHVGGVKPRDAAVVKDAAGPWSDAFLPPTNAGEADPHGPAVVSPGLHAVPPAPIRPGEVFVDDVARQEAEETELAVSVLVEGVPATSIASDEPPGGPLGLSDPGSVGMGIREAKSSDAAPEATPSGSPAAAKPRSTSRSSSKPKSRSARNGGNRQEASS